MQRYTPESEEKSKELIDYMLNHKGMMRYTPALTGSAAHPIFMQPDPNGEWVRYSDFLTSGSKGGSSKSDAKVNASRENGKKGGRPRKVKEE